MKTDEFKQLEELLEKLGNYLGATYCIVPAVIQDGYHIGLYDEDGKHTQSEAAPTLELCAKKCLKK